MILLLRQDIIQHVYLALTDLSLKLGVRIKILKFKNLTKKLRIV